MTENIEIKLGDCLEVLKTLPDNSIDSIVTDPPYGLKFCGEKWDKGVPSVDCWKECLRVLKPGGYLLAFAGTRTQHLMCSNIENAGFEIRDMIAWVYGEGFPKGENIAIAIDKKKGLQEDRAHNFNVASQNAKKWEGKDPLAGRDNSLRCDSKNFVPYEPKCEESRKWNGWNTALKPAFEPITMARKPFPRKSTCVQNVLEYGTGAINIDECRVPVNNGEKTGWNGNANPGSYCGYSGRDGKAYLQRVGGRYPANFIHDGSHEVLDLFPSSQSSAAIRHNNGQQRLFDGLNACDGFGFADEGNNSRFFYCAKASAKERGEYNKHTTVKPVALMQYLTRLVTQKGGTVLDPFLGSGTTAMACVKEGFKCIGIEKNPEYYEIAKKRVLEV